MDRKDKAILAALQDDATMTVAELAERIGLSPKSRPSAYSRSP